MDYSFVCQINRLVEGYNLVYNAGFIRNVPVTIGGTTLGKILLSLKSKADLLRIREIPEPTEQALTLMLYILCENGDVFG